MCQTAEHRKVVKFWIEKKSSTAFWKVKNNDFFNGDGMNCNKILKQTMTLVSSCFTQEPMNSWATLP